MFLQLLPPQHFTFLSHLHNTFVRERLESGEKRKKAIKWRERDNNCCGEKHGFRQNNEKNMRRKEIRWAGMEKWTLLRLSVFIINKKTFFCGSFKNEKTLFFQGDLFSFTIAIENIVVPNKEALLIAHNKRHGWSLCNIYLQKRLMNQNYEAFCTKEHGNKKI